MNILVTGADGFLGKNLCLRLVEAGFNKIIKITRATSEEQLIDGLVQADFVFHLAGINRPENDSEFETGNSEFTKKIVNVLATTDKKPPVMLSSSTQAVCENTYGHSKALAEKWITDYGKISKARYYIYRLPNVFGKWCKPGYNSFVATFCHNLANDKEISIHNPDAEVTMIYIDDFCSEMITLVRDERESGFRQISPIYAVTVGYVANMLNSFKKSRDTLITEEVGQGFVRALYSTWLSYLNPESFSYKVPAYSDERGVFCEMLKTPSAGQFSFFSAHPGITRGGHYHHTKNEKFLVIKGQARFKFEHVITGEKYELVTSSDSFEIVETAPGWSHDITNIGDDELLVMLWANEIFDREVPDTIARALS
ncbi:NAD-dependent epimerase/dehydratase family protein [Erwinia sp. P6884]|uniref:UDP-2-acetamido-2,6-beta-L-arabino-hexul-4-ose reductase n=1 Tax=Erwinia sp. P6884 TaxID=3141450 RepID=UPI0031852188